MLDFKTENDIMLYLYDIVESQKLKKPQDYEDLREELHIIIEMVLDEIKEYKGIR